MKKVVKCLAIFSLVLMLFGCGGPDDTVKSFYKAMDAGKVADAYSYLSSATQQLFALGGGAAVLMPEVDKIKMKKGIKSIDIIKKEVNSDAAVVQSVVNFNDSSRIEETNSLIKEDGKWKIFLKK